MKVAITGSAGFIGSNLVKACLLKGWDVFGIDNFSGSNPEMSKPERYSDLPGKYSFRKLDINDTVCLSNVIIDYDVLFHLAALPRVSFSTNHPLESNHNNITGTLSVLEAARKAGIKRVVYSASSSMYGGENILFPTPETTSAHPRSNYALQKHTGLEYCRLFSELYGLDTCSLVYFNVYGPLQLAGGGYSTVIPAFLSASMNDESCRIDGDGAQSRDFCYIDNVVQANILAAEYSGKLMGDKFNIACGETHSVLEVYELIKKLSKKDLQKHHVDARLGDPMKSHADIDKAVRVLGYEPQANFDEGMKKTADWWKAGCPVKFK